MTYQNFEDLPVWNEAIRLAEQIYALTEGANLRGHGSLRDQLERAGLSVSNNIAERFERGTTADLLKFIYIARGSAGEVRSILRLMERLAAFNNFKSQILDLIALAVSCSRQLRGWADSLQNSPIKGQRYKTDKEKAEAERKERAKTFTKKLRDMLPPNHPLRQQESATSI
jgi:four helix bundle protein